MGNDIEFERSLVINSVLHWNMNCKQTQFERWESRNVTKPLSVILRVSCSGKWLKFNFRQRSEENSNSTTTTPRPQTPEIAGIVATLTRKCEQLAISGNSAQQHDWHEKFFRWGETFHVNGLSDSPSAPKEMKLKVFLKVNRSRES
jgi:hypothetical protein